MENKAVTNKKVFIRTFGWPLAADNPSRNRFAGKDLWFLISSHNPYKAGFAEYTIPDKSGSRLQKYHLTKKGAAYLKEQGKK